MTPVELLRLYVEEYPGVVDQVQQVYARSRTSGSLAPWGAVRVWLYDEVNRWSEGGLTVLRVDRDDWTHLVAFEMGQLIAGRGL